MVPVPAAVQERQGQLDQLRFVAVAAAVSYVLGASPVTTLYQRTCSAPACAGPAAGHLRGMAAARQRLDEFKGFHREASLGHVLGSGLMDLLDGSLSGNILSALRGARLRVTSSGGAVADATAPVRHQRAELTKFGWAVMTLEDDEAPAITASGTPAGQPAPSWGRTKNPTSLVRWCNHLVFTVLGNAACFGLTAAMCLPLHVASFQVRHHRWRGFHHWRCLPTCFSLPLKGNSPHSTLTAGPTSPGRRCRPFASTTSSCRSSIGTE